MNKCDNVQPSFHSHHTACARFYLEISHNYTCRRSEVSQTPHDQQTSRRTGIHCNLTFYSYSEIDGPGQCTTLTTSSYRNKNYNLKLNQANYSPLALLRLRHTRFSRNGTFCGCERAEQASLKSRSFWRCFRMYVQGVYVGSKFPLQKQWYHLIEHYFNKLMQSTNKCKTPAPTSKPKYSCLTLFSLDTLSWTYEQIVQ